MAVERDLVEARAFARHRLLAALVSGAPGGREVRTPSSGRLTVGGIALAVLLTAVGAAVGVLAGHPGADEDHGARPSSPSPKSGVPAGEPFTWRRIGDSNP